MKKLFTILAIIASVFAVILSVLPLYKLAIFPAISSLVFGLIAFYLSKKTGSVKKIIQFAFLLTITASALSIYKSVTYKAEVVNTEVIEEKEIKFEEEAIEELEELEELNDLEDIELEIEESELEGIVDEIDESDLEEINHEISNELEDIDIDESELDAL